MSRWVYEKVVLVAMSCDGAQVTLQAKVKSLEDLGRFLLNMYQATDLFAEVLVTQANGFASGSSSQSANPVGAPSPGGEIGGSQASLAGIGAISESVQQGPATGTLMDITVVCRLRRPIVVPTFGAAASAPGSPGSPGAPGSPGVPAEPFSPAPTRGM